MRIITWLALPSSTPPQEAPRGPVSLAGPLLFPPQRSVRAFPNAKTPPARTGADGVLGREGLSRRAAFSYSGRREDPTGSVEFTTDIAAPHLVNSAHSVDGTDV